MNSMRSKIATIYKLTYRKKCQCKRTPQSIGTTNNENNIDTRNRNNLETFHQDNYPRQTQNVMYMLRNKDTILYYSMESTNTLI